MKYIRLHTTDPYLNLAIEEYLFAHTRDDVFMLWQNRPTVVIGKNQNAYAEVNLSYAGEAGITVSRRITGGGAVYHDLGNVNYTFITSADRAEALDYAYFHLGIYIDFDRDETVAHFMETDEENIFIGPGIISR